MLDLLKRWVRLSRLRSFPSYHYLKGLMSQYRTKDLVHVDPDSFKTRLQEFLRLRDHQMEGFEDPTKQRDLSIRFHWGHDHDFGDFFLRGGSGERHLLLLATFIDRFKALPKSLEGLRVLDIGCWTGGTSLLLRAMGAEVVAIEEVKKYSDCLSYLKHAFHLERLEPKNCSLFECTTPDFQDAFDIVLFAGVLYHVTDPILALRITFNCLKDGGICLLESAGHPSKRRILSYQGPTVTRGGCAEKLNRSGWNWFFPSPMALRQMMEDVGYQEIQMSRIRKGRIFATAKRVAHTDILRAGLSQRRIR